jgi:hypothetical protein
MEQSALTKKMGIPQGAKISLVNAPAGFEAVLGALPAGAAISGASPAEVVMLFCERKADLDSGLPSAIKLLAPGGDLWVAYQKGKSKPPRDLTRDVGWEALEGTGLEAVNLVSIDDTWSGFKFKLTGKVQPTEAEQLEEQYTGSRAGARPIYERVVAEAMKLGSDIELSPRKTYVALSRKNQFALLSPGTGGRLDVGLKLKGTAATGRLQESPEFGSGSITHKVTLRAVEDVDAEFLGWLKTAYESTGRSPAK